MASWACADNISAHRSECLIPPGPRVLSPLHFTISLNQTQVVTPVQMSNGKIHFKLSNGSTNAADHIAFFFHKVNRRVVLTITSTCGPGVSVDCCYLDGSTLKQQWLLARPVVPSEYEFPKGVHELTLQNFVAQVMMD